MKTCVLLAMGLILLLQMGCSNGFIGTPSQDQAWSESNALIVAVYNCRMLPPDNSWEKDITPSPFPDSIRYISAALNGKAGHPSLRMGGSFNCDIPFHSSSACPERSPIKLVMRDENNRVGS